MRIDIFSCTNWKGKKNPFQIGGKQSKKEQKLDMSSLENEFHPQSV